MEDRPEDRDDETRRNPINDLYRLADIKRWHIVKMDQKQSVAEHSFFVALLAMRFAAAIGCPVGRVVQYALLHDAEESWTGDIPSPMKSKDKLPYQEMMGDMHIDSIAPITRAVVKICDYTESIKFLSRNGSSRHTEMVKSNTIDKLWDYYGACCDEYPNFNWDKGLAELKFFLENSEETFIDDYV